MVSEEKIESGFRNVGGDRFNRSSSSLVVVVFSGFRAKRAGLGLGTLEVRDPGVR